jgi:hypothetical protein
MEIHDRRNMETRREEVRMRYDRIGKSDLTKPQPPVSRHPINCLKYLPPSESGKGPDEVI